MAQAESPTLSGCTFPVKNAIQSEAASTQIETNSVSMTHDKLRIFDKIISSDMIIQSQQQGEPDLTETQKRSVLSSLMQDKPGAFLMRFGTLLNNTDLDYIESVVKLDYEVDYRLKELKKSLGRSSKSHRKLVQNRRFQCLNELMENSSYFSEEEMRHRNPLLFEHYVGQYLTQEERDSLDMSDRTDLTLSGVILNKMKIDRRRELLKRQHDLESGQIVETDSDNEDESMEVSQYAQVSDQEKKTYHQEFLRAMQLSFLNGEDSGFDYSKVDCSEEYDSLDMIGKDAEDAYFDEELPIINNDSS